MRREPHVRFGGRAGETSRPRGRHRASRASQIPLYHQVANDIRQRIASGTWAPGKRIPGETELTEIYGASRITIRQALANLAHVASSRASRDEARSSATPRSPPGQAT